MHVMRLEELASHDVLEFCYCIRYPEHWNADSVFVSDDDSYRLSPYLEQVIPNYPYDGPQEVTVAQWERIERLAWNDGHFQEFFQKIREWKRKDPAGSNCFWVYGV